MDCEAMRLGGDSIFFHQAAKIRLSVEVSHKMQVQGFQAIQYLNICCLCNSVKKKSFNLQTYITAGRIKITEILGFYRTHNNQAF
jgi:hypothetical protein